MIRSARILGAALVCALAVSCSSEQWITDDTGMVIATHGSADDGFAALLIGSLRNDHGCLVVKGEDGAQYVPVFPEDQVFAASGPALITFRDAAYSEGSVIELGGGTASYDLPGPCRGAAWFVSPA